MTVIITPPNLALQRKAKVRAKPGAGVDMAQALAAGDAVLAVRLGEAKSELQRLLGRLAELSTCAARAEDGGPDLLTTVRQVGDTAGTFDFIAMTAVARSLEEYLLAQPDPAATPDPTVILLHTEALGSLLGRNSRGDLGLAERQLLDGLRKVAEKSLARAGVAIRGDAGKA